MYVLPSTWNYGDFFTDIQDQNPHAMTLYKSEVEKIIKEESEL